MAHDTRPSRKTRISTSISTLKTLISQQQKLVVSKSKRVTGGEIKYYSNSTSILGWGEDAAKAVQAKTSPNEQPEHHVPSQRIHQMNLIQV